MAGGGGDVLIVLTALRDCAMPFVVAKLLAVTLPNGPGGAKDE